MAKINIYLTFSGNCEEAFNFYKSILGGEFNHVARYKDMPAKTPVSDADGDKILFIGLPVSKETILMGCDAVRGFCWEAWGDEIKGGNNFSACISPDSEADARRIFSALAEGGKIVMPLEKQIWGSLNGLLTDKFGINWMVDYWLGE